MYCLRRDREKNTTSTEARRETVNGRSFLHTIKAERPKVDKPNNYFTGDYRKQQDKSHSGFLKQGKKES